VVGSLEMGVRTPQPPVEVGSSAGEENPRGKSALPKPPGPPWKSLGVVAAFPEAKDRRWTETLDPA